VYLGYIRRRNRVKRLSGAGRTRTSASSVHVWKRSVTALVFVVQAAGWTRIIYLFSHSLIGASKM